MDIQWVQNEPSTLKMYNDKFILSGYYEFLKNNLSIFFGSFRHGPLCIIHEFLIEFPCLYKEPRPYIDLTLLTVLLILENVDYFYQTMIFYQPNLLKHICNKNSTVK